MNGFKNCLHIRLYCNFFNCIIYFSGVAFIMKNYALKWVLQRITATIMIPLTFWFIYSAISISKMGYDEINTFFNSYINSILFYVMMISMLLHSKLGLQTIVDDYVTSKKISKNIKRVLNINAYILMILITIFIVRNIL